MKRNGTSGRYKKYNTVFTVYLKVVVDWVIAWRIYQQSSNQQESWIEGLIDHLFTKHSDLCTDEEMGGDGLFV